MNVITENIQKIQSEIYRACSTRSVIVVCVSKKQPVDVILEAYKAGIRDFGESRVQEFEQKKSLLPSDIRWHFIGTLQPNKARKAVGAFHLIHSVDSLKLLQKLSQVGQELDVTTSLLIQVNTSREETKHGFSEMELEQNFACILSLPRISVQGLMTMAASIEKAKSQETIQESFNRLHALKKRLEDTFHVQLPHLSMGMSQDYLVAIQEGATIVRIGSLIFS